MAKRMGIWMLVAMLAAGSLSCEVLAAEKNVSGGISSDTWVNPMYAGIADVPGPAGGGGLKEGRAGSGYSGYLSERQASGYLRSQLVKRSEAITVKVKSGLTDGSSLALGLLEKAVAAGSGITGNAGREGDYIYYHLESYRVDISYSAAGGYTLAYSVDYLTTQAQEAQVTAKVSSLLSSLGIGKMTAYGKIKTIYDYICRNVAYDYAGLCDSSVGKYTAYNALVCGKAVCQGYASLFYRMAMEAGVPARIIPGRAGAERHAWNIVKLGSRYYNLDSTWDAGKEVYAYFLKGSRDFPGHVRDAQYQADAFQRAYPMYSASGRASRDTPVYSLSEANVSGIRDKAYTGKKRIQDAVLELCGVTLKEGRDYKVFYKKNRKPGTAVVVFTGKGNYAGKLKKTYRIIRKKRAA